MSDAARGAEILDADDAAFAEAWRAMTIEQRSALPDEQRARGFDRYQKLTPWVGESIRRAERAAAQAMLSASLSRKPERHPLIVVDANRFLAEPIPERKALLRPILLEQSLAMVHGWRGVGKTYLAWGIGYAVASGGKFLHWTAAQPRKVFILDGEMPAKLLQDRLAAIVRANEQEPPDGYLRLATLDRQTRGMPDLATYEGQDIVDAEIEADTALIVVDNLSSLVRRGGAENEAESWLAVAEWALAHRAQGRSVLFIHHSGKSGAQRGTSKREDLLDLVIGLRRPSDYNPATGAVFELHFEKARGLYGDDVAPFEARLTTTEDDAQVWTTRPVEDTTLDRVVELHELGMNQREIADELGIHKSNVCRALQKAKTEGKLAKQEGAK